MLGPIDIEDWTTDEAARLSAEIRLLPVVQAFRRGGELPGLPPELRARLSRFAAGEQLAEAELAGLLKDLRQM